MSLQTKTFTYGSVSTNEFRYYKLELTLTEESASQTNNTSNVSYTLKLINGKNNRFNGIFNCTLKLNGSEVASAKYQRMFDYNTTFTLLSGTATVEHGTDGSLNMPIAVVIDTAESNSYSPSDRTITWSWPLTTIPRASKITSAASVILGKACSVKWTPNSASFRYNLTFSIGDWTKTIKAIHPNTTGAYTYTQYILPLEIAQQITNASQGTMMVTMTTCSDAYGEKPIGNTSSTSFNVTVPDNADTQPTVAMDLTAVSPSGFAGLYLQRQSKVQATFNANAKLGASIKGYGVHVEGTVYGKPYLSKTLTQSGETEILGAVVDSRGIYGYIKKTITVLPYYAPKLTARAYRCNADGTSSKNGEYLKIEATRDYAPVKTNGEQKNFCKIQYRYKMETAPGFTGWETILGETAAENTVTTRPLLNGGLSKTKTYTVEVRVEDTVRQTSIVTVSIPSERVFRHKRVGGQGLGLGGYCEQDDLLDVHWNQRVRKDLEVDGGFAVGGKPLLDLIYPVGSIYMSVSKCDPALLFGGTWQQLKDRFLLAAGDTYTGGTVGGEATHKLTVDEIPEHKHEVQLTVYGYDGWSSWTTKRYGVMFNSNNANNAVYYHDPGETLKVADVSGNANTVIAGGGATRNNMPPYLAVYIYKRTA